MNDTKLSVEEFPLLSWEVRGLRKAIQVHYVQHAQALSEALGPYIEREFERLQAEFGNNVKAEVHRQGQLLIEKLVEEEFTKIRAELKTKLTEENLINRDLIPELLHQMNEVLVERINYAFNRRR